MLDVKMSHGSLPTLVPNEVVDELVDVLAASLVALRLVYARLTPMLNSDSRASAHTNTRRFAHSD